MRNILCIQFLGLFNYIYFFFLYSNRVKNTFIVVTDRDRVLLETLLLDIHTHISIVLVAARQELGTTNIAVGLNLQCQVEHPDFPVRVAWS